MKHTPRVWNVLKFVMNRSFSHTVYSFKAGRQIAGGAGRKMAYFNQTTADMFNSSQLGNHYMLRRWILLFSICFQYIRKLWFLAYSWIFPKRLYVCVLKHVKYADQLRCKSHAQRLGNHLHRKVHIYVRQLLPLHNTCQISQRCDEMKCDYHSNMTLQCDFMH